VLTFFKEGRALTWATAASAFFVDNHSYPWGTFAGFKAAFLKEFADQHDVEKCIATLNASTMWHMGRRSVDDYVDTFQDLVKRAGYVDDKGVPLTNLEVQVCLLFRTGLAPHIRHHCSVVQRPAPSTLAEWKESARRFVAAKESNDLIQDFSKMHLHPPPASTRVAPRPAPVQLPTAALSTPRFIPVPQVAPAPALPKGHGDPMDVDAVRRRRLAALSRITCYACNQKGHLSRDCPTRRDLRALDDEGMPILSEADLAQIEEYKNNLALAHDAEQIDAAVSVDDLEDFGTRRL
jgi:hypothetical protein